MKVNQNGNKTSMRSSTEMENHLFLESTNKIEEIKDLMNSK